MPTLKSVTQQIGAVDVRQDSHYAIAAGILGWTLDAYNF
jgi:hypothetical protein